MQGTGNLEACFVRLLTTSIKTACFNGDFKCKRYSHHSCVFFFFYYSFFLRMIGDTVAAKPYEVNTLTGQTVFFVMDFAPLSERKINAGFLFLS